ncbi:carboxypeptidase regulatory-like domain-containing protein [Candidatus Poribacteria bacterium]|nr:carboxypeptidase regulatory-like domain-containing protein [Candidatus Poribacteria bacterium]
MQTFKWLNILFVFTFIIFIAGCGGVVLSGTVKNSSSGQPIEAVMIEGKSTTTNHPLTPVKTTADGAFRIENVKKGETYQLIFKKETITPKRENYSPSKMGKAAENLTIFLDEFSVVKGKVFGMKGSDSQPVPGAVVELLEKQSESWVSVSGMTDQTKPDGSFLISGIAKPGDYRLQISEASYRTMRYPPETSPKPLKKGDVWEIEAGKIVLEPSGAPTTDGITGGVKSDRESGGTALDIPRSTAPKHDKEDKEDKE